MNLIEIDGSSLGGQALFAALALSMATGRSFEMTGIRANRDEPGLLRRHLEALNIANQISGATLSGNRIGSQAVRVEPGKVKPGEYRFRLGMAASTGRIFQMIMPALLGAGAPSNVVIEGSTHSNDGPPFEYLEKTYMPVLAMMGAHVAVHLERHGFYPAGGGKMHCSVQPVKELSPIRLDERGPVLKRIIKVISAQISEKVARREQKVLDKKLPWPEECIEIVEVRNTAGPGNALLAEIYSKDMCEVVSSFGTKGTRAQIVSKTLAKRISEYTSSIAPVGVHLAEHLLLPLALAGRGGFRAVAWSKQAKATMAIASHFSGTKLEMQIDHAGCYQVFAEI